MKKMILMLVGLMVMAGCGNNSKEEKIEIGVTQIIEHAALDATVDGFKEAMNKNGYGDKINIEIQNAQGDFGVAQTIAGSYAQAKKDLVLAVSTPSAQTMYNSSKEIPIIISAVTDPKSVGLVGENITGTSDMSPVDKQVDLINILLPKTKTIGVVYNTSEENSRVLVEKLKEEGKRYNYIIKEKGITNVNEINQALDALLGEIDVLYTPTDNLIVAATPIVMQKAEENKIPVIGCIEDQVVQGALATETIDYKKLGYQTGMIAIKVLEGTKPSDIPVQTLEDTNLIINSEVANKLNIEIPEILKERATILK